MVRHVILWKLKDEIADKAAVKAEIKKRLEALNGNIPGMLRLAVVTGALPTSNADLMLDSEFTDAAALAGYQVNPLHVAAASYVRENVAARLCLDFEA